MQHVTAFSRPQTVPAVPATRSRPNFWILNSWRDLVLYVGTPLLILPVFALECPGHLSFCRRFRGHGASPPGNDPCLRRSRLVRPFPLALHLGTGLSAGDLHRILLVGPQRDYPGRFFLGRVAWDDADLRFLPDLRCKNRLVRRAQPSSRLLALRGLVCRRRGFIT